MTPDLEKKLKGSEQLNATKTFIFSGAFFVKAAKSFDTFFTKFFAFWLFPVAAAFEWWEFINDVVLLWNTEAKKRTFAMWAKLFVDLAKAILVTVAVTAVYIFGVAAAATLTPILFIAALGSAFLYTFSMLAFNIFKYAMNPEERAQRLETIKELALGTVTLALAIVGVALLMLNPVTAPIALFTLVAVTVGWFLAMGARALWNYFTSSDNENTDNVEREGLLNVEENDHDPELEHSLGDNVTHNVTHNVTQGSDQQNTDVVHSADLFAQSVGSHSEGHSPADDNQLGQQAIASLLQEEQKQNTRNTKDSAQKASTNSPFLNETTEESSRQAQLESKTQGARSASKRAKSSLSNLLKDGTLKLVVASNSREQDTHQVKANQSHLPKQSRQGTAKGGVTPSFSRAS